VGVRGRRYKHVDPGDLDNYFLPVEVIAQPGGLPDTTESHKRGYLRCRDAEKRCWGLILTNSVTKTMLSVCLLNFEIEL